jgi:hypothetical protein
MKRLIYECQAEIVNYMKKMANGIKNSLETTPKIIKIEMKQTMETREDILIKEKKDEERAKSILALEIMNMGLTSSIGKNKNEFNYQREFFSKRHGPIEPKKY